TGMTRYRSVEVKPADEVAELLEMLRKEDEERLAREEEEAAARAAEEEARFDVEEPREEAF
ncbi:MAG: hypothetical protein ACRD02_14705, partial [Acidimicrobiia bacterium]